MPQRNDIEYYRRRSEQEQERARAAQETAIRRVHLDLASRYAERIAEAEQQTMASA